MPVFPFLLPASDFVEDPLHDLTVQADAVNRLVQQYKQPKIEALVSALAAPAQDLEDALIQLYSQRWVNTAVGAQLDVLGKIVGIDRGGFSDDFYRLLIASRVLINRSNGGPEDIYAVFASIISPGVTMALHYYQPAAFELFLGAEPTSAQLAALFRNLLRLARGAGIWGILHWLTTDAAHSFTFDGTTAQAWDNGLWSDAGA